jgi:hypothetical protein
VLPLLFFSCRAFLSLPLAAFSCCVSHLRRPHGSRHEGQALARTACVPFFLSQFSSNTTPNFESKYEESNAASVGRSTGIIFAKK